jgi:hypothetical protein
MGEAGVEEAVRADRAGRFRDLFSDQESFRRWYDQAL